MQKSIIQLDKGGFRSQLGSGQYFFVLEKGFKKDFILNKTFEVLNNSKLEIYFIFENKTNINLDLNYNIGKKVKIKHKLICLNQGDKKVKQNFNFSGNNSTGQFSEVGIGKGLVNFNFKSGINVAPKVKKIKANLDQELFLFSPKSTGALIPGLNISSNDVEVEHSAKLYQLNSEQEFLTNSRGVSKNVINKLIAAKIIQNAKLKIRD